MKEATGIGVAGVIFTLVGLVIYFVFFGVAWGLYSLTPTPFFLPDELTYIVLNLIFVAMCLAGIILMLIGLSLDALKHDNKQLLMILGGFMVLGFFTLTTFLSSNQWFPFIGPASLQPVWWMVSMFGLILYLIAAFSGRTPTQTTNLLNTIK
jgi:magnesium-transporting ATPase (P-type)